MSQKRKPLAGLLSLHLKCKEPSNAPAPSVAEIPAQPWESTQCDTERHTSANFSRSQCASVSPEKENTKSRKIITKSENRFKNCLLRSAEEGQQPCNKGKHAGPTELSLTRRAPPPLWKLHKKPPPQRVVRDPRFDDLSGSLDVVAFSKNYKFLANMRDKERVTLQKALPKAANPQERKKIKLAIQRIDNQQRERNKLMEERRVKKMEKEAFISSLKEGRRHYVKKNSEQKFEMLAAKYQALKKEKRLDKYLERKEKKKRANELFK